MDKLVMQQMLHRLEELPPLPTVAMTLLHKTLDTDGALEEITALVEVDQALALKVLALANSPVFRRYRKITSIKEAILLLGLNMLKSLVLSISVLDTLRFAQESWFPYGQHWKHSLACAFYAKNLGQRVERNLAEEAFVTGVLHDIGKVVLALCFPQEYQEVLGGAMSTASPLHQAERERFGFDHAMVGRWTLERWKLPPQLQEPIWLHHHALSALLQKPEPSYRLAAITALADRLCYTQGFAGINQGEPLPEQWWELFSLQAWEKEAILDGVQESVDQLSQPLRRKTFQRESSTRVLQRMTKELGKLHLSAEEERQRLQEKLSQLSLLREMGMALQNASSQVEVLEILGEYVLKGLQCRSVCCGLYLEEGRILEVEVRANGMGGIQKTSRIRSREEQAAQQPAGGNGGEMRLELVAQQTALGTLSVRQRPGRPLSPKAWESLGLFAHFGALAIAHWQLFHRWQSLAEEFSLLNDTLQRSQEQLHFLTALLTSAEEGIVGADQALHVRFWNHRAAELLAQAGANLVGKPLVSLFPAAVQPEITRLCQRVIQEGNTERYEFTREGENGTGKMVSLRFTPVREEEGKCKGVAIILRDVTVERSLEREMRHIEKMKALGQMASGVAHNFNNVLTTILGRAQLLQREDNVEKIRQGLHIIEKAARDGAEIVRRIQRFTRGEHPPSSLIPVKINQVIRDALEMTRLSWETKAQARGVTITVHTALSEVPPIRGNPSELREVFVNLILNAVEAMPQGGEIFFQTETVQDRVVVRISDTGTGIDADTLGKIFDPFFTTKGGSNSGLGLSTVYGIIKQHQGEISVESKEGKGTTFWLRFPIDKSVSSPPPSATATNPSTTARILVVDDEAMICDIVEEALSSYGHRVRKAYSGYEGINCFQEEPFDLVLTDLSMSEINGYAVTRRIKALNPAVPVVLMTGWGESIDQTEARAQGIDYILSKPFNVSDLVLLVETMLVKPHQN